jgi:hypothetical protein
MMNRVKLLYISVLEISRNLSCTKSGNNTVSRVVAMSGPRLIRRIVQGLQSFVYPSSSFE